jgi:DNA-binding IclR family transcriptional regulator
MLVKQIANLFDLMELFARVKRPLSVREIVDEFGWPRSSAFNIVSTMVERGYLYQPVARGGYYPTAKWQEFARDVADAEPLPESVHRLLVELMNKTGETMILAAQEGSSVVFLDVVETPADIRYTVNIGQRLPIHVTAAGRAILAQLPDPERQAVLGRIRYQKYEKASFMTPAAVERELAKEMKEGWHVNIAVYQPSVAGVAVPFPFRNRRLAIALGAPDSRVEKRVNALGRLLRDTVRHFLAEHGQ